MVLVSSAISSSSVGILLLLDPNPLRVSGNFVHPPKLGFFLLSTCMLDLVFSRHLLAWWLVWLQLKHLIGPSFLPPDLPLLLDLLPLYPPLELLSPWGLKFYPFPLDIHLCLLLKSFLPLPLLFWSCLLLRFSSTFSTN